MNINNVFGLTETRAREMVAEAQDLYDSAIAGGVLDITLAQWNEIADTDDERLFVGFIMRGLYEKERAVIFGDTWV